MMGRMAALGKNLLIDVLHFTVGMQLMALLPAFVLVGVFVVTHHYLYVNALIEPLLEVAVMLVLGAFFAWWRQSRVDGRLLLAAEHRGLEMLLQLGLMTATYVVMDRLLDTWFYLGSIDMWEPVYATLYEGRQPFIAELIYVDNPELVSELLGPLLVFRSSICLGGGNRLFLWLGCGYWLYRGGSWLWGAVRRKRCSVSE